MAFTGKFVLTGNHLILLRLNPFELSVDREGWYFEHSMSSWQVLLSAEGGKTFPGPSYLHSKDRVEWHSIVRLPYPRSGDNKSQETFLAPSADIKTHN